MNTDIYRINNAKIICRLLPFFARGRKTILFLEGVASPLTVLHKKFLSWAYEMIVRSKVTFQTTVFIWYLNHKFRGRFVDGTDSFAILQDQDGDGLVIFDEDEHDLMALFGSRIFNANEQDKLADYSQPLTDIANHTSANAIVVEAPSIIESDDYDNAQYIRDILAIVNEYKTSFGKCNVIIKE